MVKELISVIDAAAQLGIPHKQTLFKIIRRLGISKVKQRSSGHRNQLISYITSDDFDLVKQHLSQGKAEVSEASPVQQIDQGVFYLIKTEPEPFHQV